MEGTNYRNISYAEETAKDNSIFSVYTNTWGVHVRPWYAMDKLKFSFVEVGKAGKGNSFDICMDIIKFGFPCFKKWANDILGPTGRFERIMAQEAKAGEKYPKYYKFTTGEKGDKSIGICNSQKSSGYVINASINKNGKKVFANIPVDFGDLYILADNFVRSYAAREQELLRIRVAAEKEIASHYTDPDGQTGRAVKEDEPAPMPEPEKTENSSAGQQDASSKTNAASEKHQPKSAPVKIILTKNPTKLDGEFMFDGIFEDNGQAVQLYVANTTLKGTQKEQWQQLATDLKDKKVTVTLMLHRTGEKIHIDSIA